MHEKYIIIIVALQVPSHFNVVHDSTKHHNSRSFMITYPSARADTYKYSNFPKTIKECNFLLENIVLSNSVFIFCNKLQSLLYTVVK